MTLQQIEHPELGIHYSIWVIVLFLIKRQWQYNSVEHMVTSGLQLSLVKQPSPTWDNIQYNLIVCHPLQDVKFCHITVEHDAYENQKVYAVVSDFDQKVCSVIVDLDENAATLVIDNAEPTEQLLYTDAMKLFTGVLFHSLGDNRLTGLVTAERRPLYLQNFAMRYNTDREHVTILGTSGIGKHVLILDKQARFVRYGFASVYNRLPSIMSWFQITDYGHVLHKVSVK